MSISGWMDKENVLYMCNKSDRERQILYSLTYMWNLKNSAHRNRVDWWLSGTRGA